MINGQHMRRISIAISVVIIILSINSVALAQDQEPNVPSDDEVNAIARKMYCPVCENVPLDVCPTQACMEWRELIRSAFRWLVRTRGYGLFCGSIWVPCIIRTSKGGI